MLLAALQCGAACAERGCSALQAAGAGDTLELLQLRVPGRQFELTARQVAFGDRYRFLSRSLRLLVSRKLRERIGRFTEYIRQTSTLGR